MNPESCDESHQIPSNGPGRPVIAHFSSFGHFVQDNKKPHEYTVVRHEGKRRAFASLLLATMREKILKRFRHWPDHE